MIGAPVPGVVNALQVTIPGRSPSVPSVKALGNARDEKKGKDRARVAKAEKTERPESDEEEAIIQEARAVRANTNTRRCSSD